MSGEALDDRRLKDGGDDLQLAAAVWAVFEVDIETRLRKRAQLMLAGRRQ